MTIDRIGQVNQAVHTIGDLLVKGKINVATWESQTAQALKILHVQTGLLGAGGKKAITQQDHGIIGDRLRFQYDKLRGFAQDIIGKGMSEAQFKNRLELYTQAARGTYERVRQTSHQRNEYDEERRIRTKTESCNPCIYFASMGWVRIGTLPAPTQHCDCASRCGCYFIYRKKAA